MGFLLLGLVTYIGIIASVWAISTVFADGGTLGVIGLFAWILFCMWFARETGKDKNS